MTLRSVGKYKPATAAQEFADARGYYRRAATSKKLLKQHPTDARLQAHQTSELRGLLSAARMSRASARGTQKAAKAKKAALVPGSAARNRSLQSSANALLAEHSIHTNLAKRSGGSYHPAKASTALQQSQALKKLLPQGYAMVFGKLRKINPGKPRKGIAKLKR